MSMSQRGKKLKFFEIFHFFSNLQLIIPHREAGVPRAKGKSGCQNAPNHPAPVGEEEAQAYQLAFQTRGLEREGMSLFGL